MSTNTPALDAASERRYEESAATPAQSACPARRRGQPRALGRSSWLAAGALAWFAEPARELSPPARAGLRRRLRRSRAGSSSPPATATACRRSSLFVPMLLLLPTPLVPLLVAVANPRGDARTSSGASGSGSASCSLARGRRSSPWPRRSCSSSGTPRLRRSSTCPCTCSRSRPSSRSSSSSTPRRGRLFHGLRFREVLDEMRLTQRVDVLLAPIGLLAALAAAGAPAAALLVLALIPLLLGFERERESRIQHGPRAQPRVPRHRAPPARPARGGRRVHRPPHRGRRRAGGQGRRGDGPRRGRAARDRDGRAAARHRQDRRARRDHQQARPAERRGVGGHEDPHRRGRAHAAAGRRPALQRRARGPGLARALGRRRLSRRAGGRGDPRSPPASAPPATPSTR